MSQVYTYFKQVNFKKLHREAEAFTLGAAFLGLTSTNGAVNLHYDNVLSVEDQAALDDLVASHTEDDTGVELRVSALLHDNFKSNSPSKIDFTLHLMDNVLLIKKVDMAKNGRPVQAKYYSPTISPSNLIATIDYGFVDNAMKFMIERTESLKYYRNDGEAVGPFLIHKRTYDFANIREATESIQERSTARRNIIDEIKVFLNGFIVAKTMAQGADIVTANITAMSLGGAFMSTHNVKINAFVETAANDLKTYLINASGANQEPFLEWHVSTGVRVRDYFVDRISY